MPYTWPTNSMIRWWVMASVEYLPITLTQVGACYCYAYPIPHMCTYYSAILGSSADFLCTLQKPFYIILDLNHLSIHFLFFFFLNYFCHKFSACMYVHIHKENAKYLLYLGSVFRLNQMILFHGFMFRLGWMNFWIYMPYSHYNDIKNISFI